MSNGKKWLLLLHVCVICLFPRHSLSQAAASTKIVKVTVSEGTNMAIAVSPDGKTIAMDIQGTIHTLPITGGKAKALTGNVEFNVR